MPKVQCKDPISKVFIGIDPGKAGGLVAIHSGDIWTRVDAVPMPETERDIWEWIDKAVVVHPLIAKFAVIERVHSMPKQGVASTFTFGMWYGFLRGCLTAVGVPFEEVTPQTWMKELGVPGRKGCGNVRQGKNRLRGMAQQLFPDLKIWSEPKSIGRQLAISDALLISEYCRRKHA
jgi:crossover junction endodeoxyribonuclease RuvC